MKKIILLLCVFFSVVQAMAQAGSLDLSFDSDGILTFSQGSNAEYGQAVAIQSNGKIVVAGTSHNGFQDVLLLRYNTNGSLDTTFSGDGMAITDIGEPGEETTTMTIQADGKIIIGGLYGSSGNFHCFLARFNSNGSLDNTFDGDGIVKIVVGSGNDIIYSVCLQADGKILAAGSSEDGSGDKNTLLMRYFSNGILDTSLAGNGKRITAVSNIRDEGYSVATQADASIVVAGYKYNGTSDYDMVILRYDVDGNLDTTFDGDGIRIIDVPSKASIAHAIAIDVANSKILIAGECTPDGFNTRDFVVVRCNNDGSLDNSFSGGGMQITDINMADIAYDIAMQADGKILVAGNGNDGGKHYFALARYQTNGIPDGSFASGGTLTTLIESSSEALSMALQSDGKIVLAGTSTTSTGEIHLAMARYLTGPGTGIKSIADQSVILYPNPVKGDELNLQLPEAMIQQKVQIILTDVMGRQFHYEYPATEAIKLPIAGLSQGIYFLTVSSANISLTRKFNRL